MTAQWYADAETTRRSLGSAPTCFSPTSNSDVARYAGIAVAYPGFNGTVAQALRKCPQHQAIQWRGVPTGRSHYNALQLVLERRFTRGIQARFGTPSRSWRTTTWELRESAR